MSVLDSDLRLTGLAGSSRPAAVAGLFYPGDTAELRDMVASLLRGARADGRPPKAIIAPHAGYVYSGPVAASVYARLQPCRDRIRRVVLLGPAHRVYLRALALPSVERFETPLGTVDIDTGAVDEIKSLPQVVVMDAAHAQEHSLEVHLPFLQSLFEDFRIVPLVVGDVPPGAVAEVLDRLWGGDETLIVISSDLSHYENYQTAQRLDRATSTAICELRADAIGSHDACGCRPLKGLLRLARRRPLNVELVDLRNSGDTAGSRDRVVGYGAFAVYADSGPSADIGKTLLDTARKSIESGLANGHPWVPDVGNADAPLRQPRATFVTLTRGGTLRGCIGTTEARDPLLSSVADSAYRAAFRDPRFSPLRREELDSVEISVSVLSPPEPIRFDTEAELTAALRPGIDGLIIELDSRRATFLPSVWESLPDAAAFVGHLKRKAGLAPHECPGRAWRYTAAYYSGDPPAR